MADSSEPENVGDDVGDDVQWYLDGDGTEWFAEDGVRFELADDGFAYPVVGGTTDPAGATPLDVLPEEPSDAPDAAPAADVGSWPSSEGAREDLEEASEVDDPDEDDTAGTGAPAAPFSPAANPTIRIQVPDDLPPVPAGITVREPDAPESSDSAPEAAPKVARTADGRIDAEPLLSLQGLNAGYGSLPVLKGVDLDIRPGETAVLLGLNGAGKTTTAWTICGALPPWQGKIMYDGTDVGGWSSAKAVAAGVVMVPEGRRVFPDLSVGRNLQVGAWMKRGNGDYVDAQRERVFDYFPRLREREEQLAGTLSGGEQQMLAIGRGIMADPRLLIIDEASMGLAPVIVKDVFDIISQINADGVTVLLIEQNVGALDVADVGYVMEQGHMLKVLEGEDLRDRSVVSAALMG